MCTPSNLSPHVLLPLCVHSPLACTLRPPSTPVNLRHTQSPPFQRARRRPRCSQEPSPAIRGKIICILHRYVNPPRACLLTAARRHPDCHRAQARPVRVAVSLSGKGVAPRVGLL
ncbi:hypothetical protein K523DRAFT_311541 [Schizophyllum commune Tattone D]|nr:hypothetical protein K523DRAFT_311541 [Schizophyllum commune Tattone D]